MCKNWLTLSSSDSPEIAFTFVKATRTKREEDERSPGRPNPPIDVYKRQDLKNRGVKDVLFFCVDGLPGFKEAIQAVYPQAEIQRLSLIHI